MAKLPVIVGFGGINAAGRSSFHHGYVRTVIDAVNSEVAQHSYQNLASLMNLSVDEAATEAGKTDILSRTLIRRIGSTYFDVDSVAWNKRLSLHAPHDADGQVSSFVAIGKQLPEYLPEGWQVADLPNGLVRIDITGKSTFMVPTHREFPVKAAGQLPTGFDPKQLYPSRNHPRGLQMTVFGASDALGSIGIPWEELCQHVSPDQVSVYAGSGMGQLDANGNGGMINSRANGKKVTSKQCPLGFAEMPADFINAYVLGSYGNTGTSMGACASFLYNLRMGITDIQTGSSRIAIVGNSEAPITSEIMEGYAAMGALATDKELRELDSLAKIDYRRACRPFAENCGFTIAESAQFVVLFDDELAVELGANIHGAVGDVFINADGHKKSISAPGAGNYITMARSLAASRALLGEESIRRRSFVQTHGTGTPQNRVTESHVINESAKLFGIEHWPLTAVKAYLGHSIGAASGDQLMSSLGVFEHGILPGIQTIDEVADDVHCSHLAISKQHNDLNGEKQDIAIINAKGFGGNNATASVLAPQVVKKMLAQKHGAKKMQQYHSDNEQVAIAAKHYDDLATAGKAELIYKFDHNVMGGDSFVTSTDTLRVPGFGHAINLAPENRYKDFVAE